MFFQLTHWKRLWCWEGLGAGAEGDDRGWDGWMASPTRWTWVWVDSGSWWWTGRPGVLQLMGSQRVRHDWVTELNWKRGTERFGYDFKPHREYVRIERSQVPGLLTHDFKNGSSCLVNVHSTVKSSNIQEWHLNNISSLWYYIRSGH